MRITSFAVVASLVALSGCCGSTTPDGGGSTSAGNSTSTGGSGNTGGSTSGSSSTSGGGSGGSGGACPLGSGCTPAAGGAGVCCASGCLDTSTDPNNCGGCGLVCPGGATCSAGFCTVTSCAGDSSDLSCTLPDGGPGNCCAGACLDPNASFNSDPWNCGGCGDACESGSQCQQEVCVLADGGSGYCNVDTDCPTGQSCNENGCQPTSCTGASPGTVCALAASFDDSSGICCSSSCVDPEWDDQNCGGCGLACGSGQACLYGGCVPSVACGPATLGTTCLASSGHPGTCCGTSCADTNSDSANCGGCAQACPMGGTCVGGYCQLSDGGDVSCTWPFAGCPVGALCAEGSFCVPESCSGTFCFLGLDSPAGLCCGGHCVDPTQDPGNCGGCSVSCSSGLCVEGDNSGVCIPNGTSCAGAGGCPSGESCVGGQCQERDCTTFETDLCAASDNAPGVCCGSSSSSGFSATCADPATDPNNCGGCDIACPTGQTCAAGLCSGTEMPCGAGHIGDGCPFLYDGGELGLGTCCPGGGCSDPDSDVSNCGGCGNHCATGQTCVAGSCADGGDQLG